MAARKEKKTSAGGGGGSGRAKKAAARKKGASKKSSAKKKGARKKSRGESSASSPREGAGQIAGAKRPKGRGSRRLATQPLSALLGRLADELPDGIESPVREIGEHVQRLESQIADARKTGERLWEERQDALVDDLSDTLDGIRDFVESPIRVLMQRPGAEQPDADNAKRVARRSRRKSRVPIDGHVEAGFEPVADQFRRNFERRGDHGAALCIYLDGQPVVDLWGGHRDIEQRREWQEDTIVLVFSATKGITATCIHKLAEDGVLDLEAPVAHYWPEFGGAGKERVTIHQVMTHQAGIPAIDEPLETSEVFAWDPVVAAIERQAPEWPPGKHHGYHPRTFGWILGELIRRTTGSTIGEYFAGNIARPLDLDFYIGLGAEHEHRVAELITPNGPSNPIAGGLQQLFMGPNTPIGRALSGPGELAYGPIWNSRQLHAAEIPSSNGIGSARALARHYAALIGEVDGVRIVSEETIATARKLAVRGRDKLIQIPTRFGLGYMLPPSLGSACGPGAFGHPGAGGSLGFADPEEGLAVGFVVNKMEMGLTGDARSSSVVEAAYDCL